jgi:exodeoxyribonuclease VII large subunit
MRRPDPHADPGTAGSPEDDRERTGESPLDPPSDPFISPSPLPGLFDPPARPEERTAPKAPVPTPRAPEAPRTPPWQRHPLAARAAAARTEGPEPARAAPGTRARPLRVSELNRSIQVEIESAFPAVWIVGEISNLSHPSKSARGRPGPSAAPGATGGHLYFTLKDAGSEIAAVIFASAARRLRFSPADGSEVIACGRPTLWVPRGRYQFIVEEMEPRGRGSLLAAFEALKQRLLAEGLFDEARKRPLPVLPRRIGVVTSRDGAALRDILKVLRRRHAGVSVLIAPVRVQSEGAAVEIADAIRTLGGSGRVDVLIVGRGGGSIEDLWAFNEECVARAIAACTVPVVSAVGHETDVTIADFAADVRSATPSHAAELVVASRRELLDRLAGCRARLGSAAHVVLARARRRLEQLARRPALADFPRRVASERQLLDDLAWRLAAAPRDRLASARRERRELVLRLAPRHLREVLGRRRDAARGLTQRLTGAVRGVVRDAVSRHDAVDGMLVSLSPLGVLQRGYAICLDPATGAVVRSAQQVAAGDPVAVKLAKGALDCRVEAAHREQEKENP